MHPNSTTMRLLLATALLVPGALAIGSSAACSQGSAKTAGTSDTTMVASNDSPGADKADMKKVILNVFGMT
jgi:hypothetical protein